MILDDKYFLGVTYEIDVFELFIELILLSIKDEAKKRFILDHNEIPKIAEAKTYEEKIENLEKENKQLKMRIRELLSGGKNE